MIWHIYSAQDKISIYKVIEALPENGSFMIEVHETQKNRTIQQNNSLHLWLRLLAQEMIEAGITSRTLFQALKDGFEVPPTMETLKEIVKKVSIERYGKTTSKLSTKEMQELYEICNEGFARSVGVSLPWPTKEG